ncbi:hypothetical protein CDAR_71451 [Caerostris darwini]|uniref:Uncharacterized protein n=1 Tax=Caerostris darwini TaxID=1538125 RepID=A0AAV4RHW8_9ARAC|nr:hypothetical protein CDAR_71451 [Caerostris darwini]
MHGDDTVRRGNVEGKNSPAESPLLNIASSNDVISGKLDPYLWKIKNLRSLEIKWNGERKSALLVRCGNIRRVVMRKYNQLDRVTTDLIV